MFWDFKLWGYKVLSTQSFFRTLTARPHLAGTPADKEQAEEIKQFWEDQGLKSWLTPYTVLLSYPQADNPNKIELRDGSGNVLFTTQLVEKIVRPDQNQSDVVPPFNAYSGRGTPEVFIWINNLCFVAGYI